MVGPVRAILSRATVPRTMSWRVPLADVVIAEDDLAAVIDTYRSGWLSMGPRTEEFEAAFASYTGARHALAVANGTAALHLMTLAAGLGPGDEVVVPSLTFVATVNAIAYTGATPVFADVVSLTEPWLSAAAAERAITPRTRAVMSMTYGGHSGETEELRTLCEARGLTLLEDTAHAAGSRLHDRHLGTYGAAGAFSLFSNKNLAVGEGGLVTTDDDDLAARMRLLRSHGMTTLTWDRHRGHASTYDVVALGFNYRMDEPRAALATRRLGRLDAENQARGRLDARYREAFAALGLDCALAPVDGLRSAHHLFTVVLGEDADRDAFRAELAQRGIQTSLHYPPVHRFSIYAEAAAGADLPLTDAYAARTVTLPLFAHMSAEQQDLVIEAVGLSLRGAAAGRPA
jgi:dTDP-4-amino-4,6-dideoxygalactose transaminase